jgi:molybdate transport system substrate-binding protein
MRVFVYILSLLGFLTSGEVRVALAANVSYVMPALKTAFSKQHPEISISTTVGGSGKLATQIQNGAPYDLFLSANMAYPQRLYEAGVTANEPKIYAQGALAYLSSRPRDMNNGIGLLSHPSISKIAVANPRTAPYGKAAFDALEKAGVLEKVRPKLVFGESIAQTVTYATHAADIGIVAKSALFAPQMSHYKKGINWSDVDPALYKPINQGMVIVKKTKNYSETKAFYDFILSPKAREIFQRYGYRLP